MTRPGILGSVRRAAGGGGFSPLDLATLSGWWDGSDADSFSFSSGTTISQWDDLGPNGYHLGVITGGATRSRTVNGLDAVDFAGSDVLARASAPINNSSDGSWTVFAVALPDATNSVRSIVDADPQRGTRVAQILRTSSGDTQNIGFVGGSAKTDTGPGVTAGSAYLYRSLCTATTIEAFVDGAGNGGSTALGGNNNYSSTVHFGLGGSKIATTNQHFDGAICEVIACSSALGSTDIADVESYLADKWGITL